MKHFIDKYVEIHILNDPRDLSDQTKKRDRKPKARGKLAFHKTFSNLFKIEFYSTFIILI